MKIRLKRFSTLTDEELLFIYSMLKTYGEMEEIKERQTSRKIKNKFKSNNNKKPKPLVKKDSQYPDLYDFNDTRWEKCTNKKFLAYREIMEKTCD